jgi:hypothetical protein
MTSRKTAMRARVPALPAHRPAALLADVREMILQARAGVARAVDTGLTMLYWHVGRRVRQDILKEQRAGYGEQIVATLGRQLESEFGRGFGTRNLFRMIRFAEVFPDPKIVSALGTQLGWTHFRQIIPIDDPLTRDFYAEMCRIERWSTRTLEKKVGSMFFERTALSRRPDKLIRQELKGLREEDKVTPDLVFRDPYILDFLGLRDTYAEKDIEAADKGQMELYLGWLKRNGCEPGEAAPLGMILCAGKSEEHIALLELHKSGIHVASYWTDVLPKKELERKLREAVQLARARLAAGRTVRGKAVKENGDQGG